MPSGEGGNHSILYQDAKLRQVVPIGWLHLVHLDDFFAASEALANITSEFKNFDINGI